MLKAYMKALSQNKLMDISLIMMNENYINIYGIHIIAKSISQIELYNNSFLFFQFIAFFSLCSIDTVI